MKHDKYVSHIKILMKNLWKDTTIKSNDTDELYLIFNMIAQVYLKFYWCNRLLYA